MPATKPIVMISSTVRDIARHRQKVFHACRKAGFDPQMMEDLSASNRDAIEASLAMVDEADVYLGIFAHRYGYIPASREISITEMEYDHAAKTEVPRLIFLMHQDHPLRAEDVETGSGAEKLKALKRRLETERVAGFFISPEDLSGQVFEALTKQRGLLKARDSKRPGHAGTWDSAGAPGGQEIAADGGDALTPDLPPVVKSGLGGLAGGFVGGLIATLWAWFPRGDSTEIAAVSLFGAVVGVVIAGAYEAAVRRVQLRAEARGDSVSDVTRVMAGALGGAVSAIVIGALGGSFFMLWHGVSSLPELRLQRMPAAVMIGVVVWALVIVRPGVVDSAQNRWRPGLFAVATGFWAVILGMAGWIAMILTPQDFLVREGWASAIPVFFSFGFHGFLAGLAIGLATVTWGRLHPR